MGNLFNNFSVTVDSANEEIRRSFLGTLTVEEFGELAGKFVKNPEASSLVNCSIMTDLPKFTDALENGTANLFWSGICRELGVGGNTFWWVMKAPAGEDRYTACKGFAMMASVIAKAELARRQDKGIAV